MTLKNIILKLLRPAKDNDHWFLKLRDNCPHGLIARQHTRMSLTYSFQQIDRKPQGLEQRIQPMARLPLKQPYLMFLKSLPG